MIRYLDIRYPVISRDTGHDVTIYRDMPCDITHTRSPRNTRHKSKSNENPPPRCGLLFVFFGFVSALILAVFVWPFLSFFCCPSAGRIIGLTVSPANSNLVPSGLGLLPERMHVSFCFIFHFFSLLLFLSLSFSFLIPAINTWYSL